MTRPIITAALAVASIVMATALIAQPGFQMSPEQQAASAVDTRKSVVRLFNFNMGPINGLARGGEYDAEVVERNARRIASLAPMLPETFAAMDTREFDVNTTALDAIWDDFDAFEQRANDFAAAMTELADMAAAGDQEGVMAAAGGIARTHCGGCHNQFRE